MFGYVRPAPDKLTAEEEQRYRALYCGLCHTLARRYGAGCRMALNYDFTFLAALLSGTIETEAHRCIASPLKKRPAACENPALDLAAGEYVTEIRVNFGTVQAGFHEGSGPVLYVTTLANLDDGYRIINRTDVGGRIGEEWIVAKDTWITVVWGKPKGDLPKTGV